MSVSFLPGLKQLRNTYHLDTADAETTRMEKRKTILLLEVHSSDISKQ